MSSEIRRKIAKRILQVTKFQDQPKLDDLAKKVRLKKRVVKKYEPIDFQLPVVALTSTQKEYPNLHPNDISRSFKDDESITDVRYDATGTKIIFGFQPSKFTELVLEAILPNKDIRRSNILLKSVPTQKIIVEFSSPNIAKPFHAGHLRSTIIGNFVTNIYKLAGHKVTSLNYLGDWGTQFGMLSLGYEMMGSDMELKKDPINYLFNLYVSINKMAQKDPSILLKAKKTFRDLEQGNEEAVKRWQIFRDLSVNDLIATYKRLGISFNEFHGESMYRLNTISKLIGTLRSSGCLQTMEGAEVIEMNSGPKPKFLTLVKSDGSTLYLTRDIAAAIDRYQKYSFDQMLYVVENGQHDHFEGLRFVLSKLQIPWYKTLHHIKFGRIHNMSTRKGEVVFLKDILEEAKNRMLDSMEKSPNTKVKDNPEEVASVLGISAVFVNDMKNKRIHDYSFDWEKCLYSKGDSGLQLQYTHARLCSLQETCGVRLKDYDVRYLTEPEAIELIHQLARFDEMLETAFDNLEPCAIVNYLFHLRRSISSALDVLQVKDVNMQIAQARLALFTAAQFTLNQGMKILGVVPLRRM